MSNRQDGGFLRDSNGALVIAGQAVESVASYGAVGDGSTDDTAAIQAAHAAAAASGRELVFGPYTYNVSDRLHGTAATTDTIRYRGVPGKTIIQRTANKPIIDVAGSNGTGVALSANATTGDTSVTVASLPASLAADDYVRLRAENVAVTGGTAKAGEVLQVKTITGTGPYTIGFYGPIEESYTTANTATIDRISFAGFSSYIEGVTFRQTAQARDDSNNPLVRFDTCRDIRVVNCDFKDADVQGVEFRHCIEVAISRCRFANLTDDSANNRFGYGINLDGNCRDIRVDSCTGRFCRHLFTTSAATGEYGVPRHVVVAFCQAFNNHDSGFSPHIDGKYLTFVGCESHSDGSTGFYIRPPHTTLIGCVVTGSAAGKASIYFAEGQAADGQVIGGRVVIPITASFGIEIDSPRVSVHDLSVTGPASGSNANFRVDANGTDSAFIGVRSLNPAAAAHISYASGVGTNHVVQGGFFNSSSVKSVVSAPSGVTVRVSGGPYGTNLFNYGANGQGDNLPTFVAKAGNYTLNDFDRVVTMDATAAARTVTLPTAVSLPGREFIVKKIDSSANAVTVATTSSQTIDGASTVSLASQYDSVRVVSNGANWLKI